MASEPVSPPPSVFDDGGLVPPIGMAVNSSDEPEAIVSADDLRRQGFNL